MIQKLTFFLSTIFIVFLFASCEKELSYENGGDLPGGGGTSSGTAIFSPAGASGGVCTGAVLDGVYTASKSVADTNSVDITVNVDSIGTYSISTNTVNGISFSGSGTFISTGLQTITLQASGTPAAAGNFNYTAGTNGCIFSVTVSPGGVSTSVFTFDGGTSNCTGAVLNGIYVAGTALGGSNTVTLSVNVTTPGTYFIATPVVNGISFNGTGTFVTTGTQNITLTGTGTPTTAGAFTYLPGPGGCSFTVLVDGSGTPAADYYFDVTIDGERIVKYANGVPGGYGLGYGTSGFDDVEYSTIISPTDDPIPAGMPYLEVGKGLFIGSFSATEQAFKNFFPVGSFPYAAPNSFEGIHIVWVDKNGKIWETNNNPGTQSGSSFSITSVQDYHDILGAYVVKFSATFNCKLYDDAGNSITLTNGKIIGEFEK